MRKAPDFGFKIPRDVNPRPHLIIFWFHYLRLSPSYQLAIRYRAGNMSEEEKVNLPADFDLVLKTYDDFGNVWAVDYVTWTKTRWRDLFDANEVMPGIKTLAFLKEGQEHKEGEIEAKLTKYLSKNRPQLRYPKTFIMAIPMYSNKNRMLDEVSFALDVYYEREAKEPPVIRPVPKPKYALLITKIRDRAIKISHQIIVIKANNPKWKLWYIAIKLKLSPNQTETIKKAEELRAEAKQRGEKLHPSQKATDEKLFVNAVVGRYMRHAYLLAENAARGKFPSLDEIYDEDGKKVKTYFDYPSIRQLLIEEHLRRSRMDDDDD
jgi:hypothetical protein